MESTPSEAEFIEELKNSCDPLWHPNSWNTYSLYINHIIVHDVPHHPPTGSFLKVLNLSPISPYICIPCVDSVQRRRRHCLKRGMFCEILFSSEVRINFSAAKTSMRRRHIRRFLSPSEIAHPSWVRHAKPVRVLMTLSRQHRRRLHDITINPDNLPLNFQSAISLKPKRPEIVLQAAAVLRCRFDLVYDTRHSLLQEGSHHLTKLVDFLTMAHTHLSICLHLKNGGRIGPGKIALLEAIQTKGSIKAVARHLGMSSRRIWLLVQQINDALQQRAVSRPQGGWQNSAIVTPVGERVIDLYHSIENLTRTAAFQELQELARLTRRRPPDRKKRSVRAPGGPSCAA